MNGETNIITLPLPFHMGSVNCYLIQATGGCILIDSGGSNQRSQLERRLETAGCKPDNLLLIILTHGDFDHIGNSAYLRSRFGAPIAMHNDDAGMAVRGDMFWNRKSRNALIGAISPLLLGFHKSDRFEPDRYLEDGQTLAEYGLDAQIVTIPGHSKGSIGVLTAGGDLFCGDLFENTKEPAFNAIMDDPPTAKTSVEKLKALTINTVYPGHGQPFPIEAFFANN